MIIKILFKIIVAHMVGDYVLQSDYIAKAKETDIYLLVVHSFLYTLSFYLLFGFSWHLLVILIPHMIVDFLKTKKITNLWQDQVIHYITALVYFI